MMKADQQPIQPEVQDPEENEIDLMELAKKIWAGRKTVYYSLGVAFLLGLLVALFSHKEYTVETVLVPQMSTGNSSSLSSLASLAGINMNTSQSSELTPLVYPQIVNSIPFQLELMKTPLHFEKVDTAVSIYDYQMAKKPSVMAVVMKYTIGLPGVIMSAIRKPQPDLVLPTGEGEALKMICLSKKQDAVRKSVGRMIALDVNSKEGYLTLTVHGPEPIMTAELAQKTQELLQCEIIKFKVEKSEAELKFIQERYDEVKREAESYQEQVATNTDRAKSTVNTLSQLDMVRLQSKYNIANAVYTDLAKQLEQAKLQVKKDTPVFTILKPVTVPIEKSKPQRSKIIVIYLFLGGLVGCGIVWAKDWFANLKQKWNEPAEKDPAA